MDRMSVASEHEGDSGVESTHSTGESLVYIRISVPELNLQKCLRFNPDETVWTAKQQILKTLAKDLKDELNYGIFCPANNGRAGKFMDEERLLKDYSLPGPIGFLEFKYKRRVYKQTNINPRKLKQLRNKSTLKQFMDAIRKMDVDKITKLTDKGLDPNFQDQDSGETPLSLAVTLLRPRELMMALVGGGAMFDFRTRSGLTPLHSAARLGNFEALGILLDLGSGVNYRDDRGLTPLYHAVCHSTSSPCINLLLYNYATVGTTDSAGWTELHQACKAGRVQHVEQLLFYGIDMNQQNSGGNTALHVAAVNNQEECVRILLFRGADHTIQNYANQTAAEVAIIANNKLIADLINEFSPSNIVPIQELPSYNTKRRGRMFPTVNPGLSLGQRCRSNPQLYSCGSVSSLNQSAITTPCIRPGYGTVAGPHQLAMSCSSVGSGMYTKRPTAMRQWSETLAGYDSDSLRSLSVSSAGSVAGEVESYTLRKEAADCDIIRNSRTVLVPKSSCGFGFVLRGAKCKGEASISFNSKKTMLDFQPTARCPGLQFVEHVDPGGAADQAGLLPGDFIIEINGISVVRASHEYAVQLILQTNDVLLLNVVTVTVRSELVVNGNNKPLATPNGGGGGMWRPGSVVLSPGISHETVHQYDYDQSDQDRVSLSKSTRKTSDCGVKLSKYGSVPVLPQDGGYWSVPRNGPIFPSRPVLNTVLQQQKAAAADSFTDEVVYAVPVTDSRYDTSSIRSTPPIIPPQDYKNWISTGSDFVPITTKLPHIYANVSQSIGRQSSSAAATTEVESSFRPGRNARLSLDDGEQRSDDVSWRQSQQSVTTAADESSSWTANVRENGRKSSLIGQPYTGSPFVYVQSYQRDTASAASADKVDLEPDYDDSLPPPPPPPPLPEGCFAAEANDADAPKPPPLLNSAMFCSGSIKANDVVKSQSPADVRGSGLPAATRNTSNVHADAVRQVVAMRREYIESSDMGSVAATIDERVHKGRPLQRVLYRAVVAGEQSGVVSGAPLSLAPGDHMTQAVEETHRFVGVATRTFSSSDSLNSYGMHEGKMAASVAVADEKPVAAFNWRASSMSSGHHPSAADSLVSSTARRGDCVQSTASVSGLNKDYASLIIPPPPPPADFTLHSSGSVSAGHVPEQDSASRGVTVVDESFDFPTPPPPPGFDDEQPTPAAAAAAPVAAVDFRLRPIAQWTVDEVTCWLESLQMAEHVRRFVSNAVDGHRLTELGRSELIALGVTQVGQRMTLERAIKRAVMFN